jgi:putative ABC transport system permease protein
MAFYLAFKEVWRNKGRFFLFSLVIALITTLVLFIAALSEGLALANKEFLEKLDAELLIFQENVDYIASSSRIAKSKINDIQRLDGIDKVGPIGFSNGTIVFFDGRDDLNVSLIGIEANKPGSPPVISGNSFQTDRGNEIIVDKNIVNQTGIKINDRIILKTLQGTDEVYNEFDVIGITDGRQYLYQPSIFIPYRTWEQIRPQANISSSLIETTSNVLAIKLEENQDQGLIQEKIIEQVDRIDVADVKTAYESLPGFQAQQSTLNTQRYFTLLIGILVIGGFFQIQMLQKIPQIGVLKAIGVANPTVAIAVVYQIIIVTTFGVFLGALVSFGLSAAFPPGIPIVFTGNSVTIAIVTLLLIGPIGGLVSVRLAISVEPLIALGLSS